MKDLKDHVLIEKRVLNSLLFIANDYAQTMKNLTFPAIKESEKALNQDLSGMVVAKPCYPPQRRRTMTKTPLEALQELNRLKRLKDAGLPYSEEEKQQAWADSYKAEEEGRLIERYQRHTKTGDE